MIWLLLACVGADDPDTLWLDRVPFWVDDSHDRTIDVCSEQTHWTEDDRSIARTDAVELRASNPRPHRGFGITRLTPGPASEGAPCERWYRIAAFENPSVFGPDAVALTLEVESDPERTTCDRTTGLPEEVHLVPREGSLVVLLRNGRQVGIATHPSEGLWRWITLPSHCSDYFR